MLVSCLTCASDRKLELSDAISRTPFALELAATFLKFVSSRSVEDLAQSCFYVSELLVRDVHRPDFVPPWSDHACIHKSRDTK